MNEKPLEWPLTRRHVLAAGFAAGASFMWYLPPAATPLFGFKDLAQHMRTGWRAT